MKFFIANLVLFTSITVLADIESHASLNVPPKIERVEAARSCFSELKILGCGHPQDDLDLFKTCMRDVYTNLDPSCQNIMKRLYGR